MKFHKWCVENKVVTSTELGKIEWGRKKCATVFLDTFIAMVHEHTTATSVNFVQDSETGKYVDAEEDDGFSSLIALLDDQKSKDRIVAMENDVPTLTDAEYESIVTHTITRGLDISIASGISYLFRKQLLKLSAKTMDSITKSYVETATANLEDAARIHAGRMTEHANTTSRIEHIKTKIAESKAKIRDLNQQQKAMEYDVGIGKRPASDIEALRIEIMNLTKTIGSLGADEKILEKRIVSTETDIKNAKHTLMEMRAKYCSDDGSISTGTQEFQKLMHKRFPTSYVELDVKAFVSLIVKKYRNHLDRAIFVAMRRTNHYIADPIIIKPVLRGIDASSASSEAEVSELTSSDLGIGSQAGGTEVVTASNKCPDDTNTVSVRFPESTSTYTATVSNVSKYNSSDFFWDFI
jgi:hypothetical protein